MEVFYLNLSENIKKYRKEKGMTQEELANKCGLSKNGLWNYENGKREPNIETLTKIARALNISTGDLLGNDSIIEINEGGTKIKNLQELQIRIIHDLTSYCAIKGIGVSLIGNESEYVFESIVNNFLTLSTAFNCSPLDYRIKRINDKIARNTIDFKKE